MAKDTKVLACDGPARSGKTTLARNFEDKLSVPCITTGNIYRALTVLVLEKLSSKHVNDDVDIAHILSTYNLSGFKTTFTGDVLLDGNVFSGLTAPHISDNAWKVARVSAVREKIVEPLIISMVKECDYPLVFSEGREEGRLWQQAGYLGLAIFLSVDPLVAAMRERSMRIAQGQDVPELRKIMSNIMKYDLDNASRGSKPTYIDDELSVFTGKMDKQIKQAVGQGHQIVVPTSSIDANTVFQRVVKLSKVAGLHADGNARPQTSLLELV